MGALSFIRDVYTLDTLDTRFNSSSSVPYQTVIEARSDPTASRDAASKARTRAQPSKWATPEFYLYYVVFVVAVPYMFWIAYDVSRRTSISSSSVCISWGARVETDIGGNSV
jgi:hypothetical protein